MERQIDPRITALNLALTKLGPKDHDFALSMMTQFFNRGRLSDKQWEWVKKLADKANAPPVERVKHAIVGIDRIETMFAHALQKLAMPRVKIAHEYLRLTLRPSRQGGVNVYIKTDALDSMWAGYIKDGSFIPTKCPPTHVELTVAALRKFGDDPAAAAKLYGTEFKHCCFCGIKLLDPRSVGAGYGPICAENYGLPWGDETIKADAELTQAIGEAFK